MIMNLLSRLEALPGTGKDAAGLAGSQFLKKGALAIERLFLEALIRTGPGSNRQESHVERIYASCLRGRGAPVLRYSTVTECADFVAPHFL